MVILYVSILLIEYVGKTFLMGTYWFIIHNCIIMMKGICCLWAENLSPRKGAIDSLFRFLKRWSWERSQSPQNHHKHIKFSWGIRWILAEFYVTKNAQDGGENMNGGTPQLSLLLEFSLINHPFWIPSIDGQPHIGTNPHQLSMNCALESLQPKAPYQHLRGPVAPWHLKGDKNKHILCLLEKKKQ